MTRAQQRRIREALGATVDRLTFRADGSVLATRSYFYRMGCTAEQLGQAVRGCVIALAGGRWALETRDVFRRWPAHSYFRVELRPVLETRDLSAEASDFSAVPCRPGRTPEAPRGDA